jgi:hypothetical protein
MNAAALARFAAELVANDLPPECARRFGRMVAGLIREVPRQPEPGKARSARVARLPTVAARAARRLREYRAGARQKTRSRRLAAATGAAADVLADLTGLSLQVLADAAGEPADAYRARLWQLLVDLSRVADRPRPEPPPMNFDDEAAIEAIYAARRNPKPAPSWIGSPAAEDLSRLATELEALAAAARRVRALPRPPSPRIVVAHSLVGLLRAFGLRPTGTAGGVAHRLMQAVLTAQGDDADGLEALRIALGDIAKTRPNPEGES